ncbi:MAG: 1-deoxy-D-xylulose-5-phosphate reductoisomerase [Gammaproteobacteria bacterium]|nr:1-deoxy-D-xylulose-5-phosphate reductoisomerase [Pseudomonadales bacterium]MCP5346418.1 1-deoxy-D-xylulose-5-phosphate reductoisomerase [Pseudomonadales bacterium]
MTETIKVTVLGSTGSIGENTLDVIARHAKYEVFALTACHSVETLAGQCRRFTPRFAVLADSSRAAELEQMLADCPTEVLSGADQLETVAAHPDTDTVMAAIVGAAGLRATLAAVAAGKKVLLANKESLVMAGELFMDSVRRGGGQLLPIDSEHNAIYQCLPVPLIGDVISGKQGVRKVILTASGGPFLDLPADRLGDVTPEQACRHPRWEMGRKISVDSATLMNKGLEFIEACFLFDLPCEQLEVVIHPQSIVHSMVEYQDGSVIAQLANPDMRIPIAYGLAWPERIDSGAVGLDLTGLQPLEFRSPDLERFPCLRLGMDAARAAGTAPAILNAANEVAVAGFLAGRLQFDRIHRVIAEVMSKMPCEVAASLDIIQTADSQARILANELIVKENV